MALIVVVYGGLLVTAGVIFKKIAPSFPAIALITALTGGGLCIFWGIAGVAGYRKRTWAFLTSIAVTVITLTQLATAWFPTTNAHHITVPAKLLLLIILMISFAMIIYLLHGERDVTFYRNKTQMRLEGPAS